MRPDQSELLLARLLTNEDGGKLSQPSHKQVTRLVLVREGLHQPVTILCHESCDRELEHLGGKQ